MLPLNGGGAQPVTQPLPIARCPQAACATAIGCDQQDVSDIHAVLEEAGRSTGVGYRRSRERSRMDDAPFCFVRGIRNGT